MGDRVKARWGQYMMTATFHGVKENILKAGDKNHHAFMIKNWKTANQATIDVWSERIVSQRGVLRTFQILCFHAIAASLEPEHFAETLNLEFDNMGTEVRYQEYRKTLNLLGTVLEENPMIVIVKLKEEGIDCGLNLGQPV